MKHFVKLMRPQQYVKNLFILLPLFFAGKFFQVELLIQAIVAAIAFSFLSSSVYVMNDYFDIEQDKLHPSKKYRPLASGAVFQRSAWLLTICLVLIAFVTVGYLDSSLLIIFSGYWLMNLAYSFKLKHIPIIDIHIIAIGFVLRLLIGALVTGVDLSMWIVIMTFLLSLFIALAKRRDDVLIYLQSNQKMRPVIAGYSLPFIDNCMMIMAAVVTVSYLQYTTSTQVIERLGASYLYASSVFVILGIMRYLQIALVEQKSGSPTQIILKDRFIQFVLLGWTGFFVWVLYR